jgi:hypothetical protein
MPEKREKEIVQIIITSEQMKGQEITNMIGRDESSRCVTTTFVARQLLIVECVTQFAIINFHFQQISADNSAGLNGARRQIYNILEEEFQVGRK